MTCCCRLLDGERDRCLPGEHVVGSHTYRTVRTASVTLASTVSSLTDPLRTWRAARQRSSRTDATRRAISRSTSRHQRVPLSARSRQGISVYREVVAGFRWSRTAALSRQDERSDASQGCRWSAAATARFLPAVQPPVLPRRRRRLRLVVVLLSVASLPSPAFHSASLTDRPWMINYYNHQQSRCDQLGYKRLALSTRPQVRHCHTPKNTRV